MSSKKQVGTQSHGHWRTTTSENPLNRWSWKKTSNQWNSLTGRNWRACTTTRTCVKVTVRENIGESDEFEDVALEYLLAQTKYYFAQDLLKHVKYEWHYITAIKTLDRENKFHRKENENLRRSHENLHINDHENELYSKGQEILDKLLRSQCICFNKKSLVLTQTIRKVIQALLY